MLRIAHWLLNALTALSLLLCVTTIVLWCRDPYAIDYFITPHLSVLASDGALIVTPTLKTANGRRWAMGTDELRFDDLSLSKCLTLSGSASVTTFLGFAYGRNVPLPMIVLAPIPWIVRIPDWALVTALGVPPLWRLRRVPRVIVDRVRARRAGRCRSCFYDLTGNVTGVCPECGVAIIKGNA